MTPSLLTTKLLIFDVYGTLIDWETGIYVAAQPLLSRVSPPPSRAEFMISFQAAENRQQTLTPTMRYSELLSNVYTQLAESYSLSVSADEATDFGASIGRWEPFPDSPAALARLKKFYKLVVLSNVDRASFTKTLGLLGGENTFDMVFTAEDVGAYKPDTKGFEHVLEEAKKRWGFERPQCCSTAQSLFHDHVPAKKLGMLGSWIDRDGASMGKGVDVEREWEFKTLGAMADAAEQEEANKA